jgi:hypothetical protein
VREIVFVGLAGGVLVVFVAVLEADMLAEVEQARAGL